MRKYLYAFLGLFLAPLILLGAGCDTNIQSQALAPQEVTASATTSYSNAPGTTDPASQEVAAQEAVRNPFPSVFHTTLALGSSGTDVANMQQFLVFQNLYSGKDSGIFDKATQDAVIAFESKHDLTPIDGVFGSKEQAFANITVWGHPDWLTTLSSDTEYKNVNGSDVHSPAYSTNGVPAGASARCSDGTYSFSMNHRGTCSHHGGVDQWLEE